MGLFRKDTRAPAGTRATARLGPGRRLRSGRSIDECLINLRDILDSYRQPQYEHLPQAIDCGHEWLLDDAPPERAVCCHDVDKDFLFITLWPAREGSELGLFSLGNENGQSHSSPIIGHWKMRDPSLTSVGNIPAGSVALLPPEVPSGYEEEMLRMAGFPPTPANLAVAGDMLTKQFLIKAHQFISSQDPRSAERFVGSHRSADLQSIVDDLAAWNHAVLPYIQDLPLRIRALMLTSKMLAGSSFWAELER